MQDKTRELASVWLEGAKMLNLLAFFMVSWFVLPVLYTLFGFSTVGRLCIPLTGAGYFFVFLYYVPYRLDYWLSPPDERPGLFRYSAQVSRNSVFQIFCFLVLSGAFIELHAVYADPGRTDIVVRNGDSFIFTFATHTAAVPTRGEIVQCRANNQLFVRRIVGLPGETVAIVNGQVSINGRALDEPYRTGLSEVIAARKQLAPDQYLILPDDRSHLDERVILIQRKDILGRAFLRVYPLSRFGLLPNVKYSSLNSSDTRISDSLVAN